MSMTRKETAKSVIYTFDGYSTGYRAMVQGAFTGTFIVPRKHAGLIDGGRELETLKDMHQQRRFGIALRNAGNVQ